MTMHDMYSGSISACSGSDGGGTSGDEWAEAVHIVPAASASGGPPTALLPGQSDGVPELIDSGKITTKRN
jgi:hypothetical protein